MPMLKPRSAAGWIVLGGAMAAACGSANAQAKPGRLDTVLKQMDAASATFQSAQADFTKDLYDSIVKVHTPQQGMIYFLRKGAETQMGAKIMPENELVEYKDGKVRLLQGGHVTEISASGKDKGRVETFLTLGFGGSGKDLDKAWTITDQGSETMQDGGKPVQVEKLDLVSKEAAVQSNFNHVTIWVDPLRGVTLKQEFFAPSGDTQTATYTNIRVNEKKVNVAPFAIVCKGKCS